LWLRYVIPCGRDWIAEIRIIDAGKPKTPNRARVFVSQNPGVATLMSLAHGRGALEIKSVAVSQAAFEDKLFDSNKAEASRGRCESTFDRGIP
jgi:hypothetical protein